MASEDKEVTKSLYSITCKLCGAEVKTKGMSSHLKIHNMTNKEYYDKYMKKDKEDICPTCGGKNKFISITAGYKKHCSTKCSSIDPEVHAKLKATNKERYGFEYSAQRQAVKDKMAKTNKERYGGIAPSCSKEIREKTRETWLKKYGVDHPMKDDSIQEKVKKYFLDTLGVGSPLESDKVWSKIKATVNIKYGVDSPFQNEEVKEKIKLTCLGKYGCEHPMQNEEVKNKVLNSYAENDKYMEEKGYFKVKDLIKIYGHGFQSSKKIRERFFKYKDTNYLHKSYLFLIEEYIENVQSGSIFEKEVLDFVQLIYKGEVVRNSRVIIPPKELDIYIPDRNIAIECNGIYYHSKNFGISENYHMQKTSMCDKRGIRLIHINESDWKYHKEVCKSIISSSLNIYKDVINFEDCILREIERGEFYNFLIANCLDEIKKTNFAIGIYYKEELVQVFLFKELNTKECELVKKCTKLRLKVEGSLAAVTDYVLKTKTNRLITFLDVSKYDLMEYCNEGWQLTSFTKPAYTLYKNSGKEKISNEKIINSIDISNNRFLKVYDCGRAVLEIY